MMVVVRRWQSVPSFWQDDGGGTGRPGPGLAYILAEDGEQEARPPRQSGEGGGWAEPSPRSSQLRMLPSAGGIVGGIKQRVEAIALLARQPKACAHMYTRLPRDFRQAADPTPRFAAHAVHDGRQLRIPARLTCSPASAW